MKLLVLVFVAALLANASGTCGQTCRVEPFQRLRKLHLVRPDLIFYPLDWAVYC